MSREQLIESLVTFGFCRDAIRPMTTQVLAQIYACHADVARRLDGVDEEVERIVHVF